jgi:FtsP/CotA-like multicopper oxidase with cupredoxin domain
VTRGCLEHPALIHRASHSSVVRASLVVLLVAWSRSSLAQPAAHDDQPAGSHVAYADLRDTLRDQPVLRNLSRKRGTVEVNLTASVVRLALKPGVSTEAYAFNGSVPGPTLDVYEGDRVVVHFRNDLPEPTTIHWHGLHIPAEMDGSPLTPIAPGAVYDYVFTIKPGTAGTYWYHPHPDLRSGYQIAKGLFGAVIVRASDDPLRSVPEKLLILSDNRFRADGSVDFAEPRSAEGVRDEVNGREGDLLFVNGQIAPSLPIRSGQLQRWRVINVAAARIFRLSLDGHKLLHVGSDGGLFERPVEVTEIDVANSERVELLVRGTGEPGDRALLRAMPYDRYVSQTRPLDWQTPRSLLTLAYAPTPRVRAPVVPTTLRRVVALDTLKATATHVLVLSQGMINGQMMDMHRVDVRATLGATEIWQVENVVGMDHPFHLHGFQFQVIDRDGVPEPFPSWKDVVNVRKHEIVRVIVRYDDFPGLWMYHCHILDHEDHGMMGVLEVRAPPPPPRNGS